MSDPVLNNIFQQGRSAPLNQNQFGANFGGPLKKNKAFFFLNWEGFRAADARPLMERVPDITSRSPNTCVEFSCSPLKPWVKQVQTLLNLYPVPNVPTSSVTNMNGNAISNPQVGDSQTYTVTDSSGTNTYIDPYAGAFFTGTSKNFTNSDNYLARVDLQPTKSATMSFKYNMQNVDQLQGGAVPQTSTYPGSGADLNGRNQNFSYNYVQTFGSHTVNQLRLGWNRFRLDTLPTDHSLDPSGVFQNLNFTDKGFPSILLGGFEVTAGPYASLGAGFSAPYNRVDSVPSVGDNVTHTYGRHVFEAGVEVRYDRLIVDNEAAGRGVVALNSIPTSLNAGAADFASIARVNPAFSSGFERTFNAGAYDWFVQDSWRPSSNLSVNFGVRQEINQAPVEAHNLLVNDYPGTCTNPLNGSSLVCLIRSGTNAISDSAGNPLGTSSFIAPRAGFHTDFKNIGPHVGFAWSPLPNGQTVLRAGYAIAFDQQSMEPSVDMLLNPPFVQQTASYFPFLANVFPASIPPQAPGDIWFQQPYSITARDPNTRTSYVYQYHFGTETQLSKQAVFGLSYVGSGGRKLPDNRLQLECTQSQFVNEPVLCFPPLGTGVGGNALLSDSVVYQENHANSSFNSLQAHLDTHAFHHFTVHLNYQWAHSIDNASSPVAPVFLLSPASADQVHAFLEAGCPMQGVPGCKPYTINRDQLAALNNVNPALSLRAGLPTITTADSLPNDTSNNANLSGERGNSDFDVRHRFVGSYIFDVPSWSRAGRALSGWQVAGITVAQTGQPFSVYGDFFGAPLRPNQVNPTQVNNNNPNGAIDNAAPAGCGVNFPCAGDSNSSFDIYSMGQFAPGSLRRNTFYGPNLVNFDFSILKNTRLSEGKNVQFRVEFFNLLNRANFRQPFSQVGQVENNTFDNTSSVVSNPFFGQILQAQSPRQIQFALKFAF